MARTSSLAAAARTLLAVLLAAAAAAPGARAAADEWPGQDGENRWNALVKSRRGKLDEIRAALASVESRLDSGRVNLALAAANARIQTAELKLLLLSDFYSPFQHRLVTRQILGIAGDLQGAVARAESHVATLDEYTGVLESMRKEIALLQGISESHAENESLAYYSKWVDECAALLQKSRKQFQASLEDAKAVNADLTAYSESLKRAAPGRLASFLFNHISPWYDKDTWDFIRYDFRIWLAQVPVACIEQVPDTGEEWALLLAIAAAVGLGVHAAGRLLVRRLLWLPQRSAAPYGGATGRRLARGWACLSAAIGLFTANAILDFPETLLGFRLAVIFVAAWGLDTAWALKAGEQDALKTPLAPLFWLYALGNILQAMDINLALLALAWPFALLPAAAAMRRRFNAPYPLLEKGLCGVSAAVCALSAAGCVLGYSLLSFFASLTWFLLAIGIQLGMAIGKFFAAWVEGLREGEDEIAKAIVIGLGVPLLWLAILSVVAVWASDRLMSAEMLFALMNSELSILGMDFTAVSLVAAVFLFFVVRTMNRLMCAALDRMYGGSIEQGVVPSLKTLLFYGFAGAYALFALKALGVSLFNIALVAGGLSVGVGFGLQYLVNNFISGLIILFGRSLQHGDIIEVDGRQARVEKISIRETVVRTWRNAVVSIPNTEILNSKLVNWSRNNRRVRLELPVGVAYGSDLQAACQAALAAVAATPRVLTTPAPSILLSNFGASSIDLTVRVWVEDIAQDVIILSDLRIAIERAFREAGVSIPFNQLDVHIVR